MVATWAKVSVRNTLHLVEPTDGDIGKRAVGIVDDVDVVGNRPRIERFQDRERRTGIKHLRLARILQCEPDLLAVRRRRNIGAERAGLGDPPDNLVIGDRDHHGLRREGGADIAVFAIRGKNRHARTVGHDDAGLLLIGGAIKDGDVVLATDGHPDLLAVWRKERFMRRASDIGDVFDGIGCRIDEGHGIRGDRDDQQGCDDRARSPCHAPALAHNTGGSDWLVSYLPGG